MTPNLIANLIFWACGISIAVLIYQGIILPSIRLNLRYRVFELRDRLRRMVIEGKLEESDRAFQLLHDRLNFMCCSLSRLDLARVVQASHHLDEESRARVADYLRVMKSSPEEVQKIFKESLNVVVFALTFNSLFIFVFASICILVAVAVKSSFRHIKVLFWAKVKNDAAVAFVSPELATV